MNKKALLFLILISLSSLVCGDGCVMTLTYDEYGVEKDTLLSGEDSQVSVIDYRNGVEDMLISVKVTPEGEGMLWIFPVPADPEKSEIDIDITSEFPEIEGYNVKNKLGGKIKEVEGWSLISQLWSVFPAFITNPDLIKREFFHAQKSFASWRKGDVMEAGGVSGLYLEEPDYGVKVYHRINKLGLTSELLTARYGEGLKKYLAEKNLTLPQLVVDEIDWYIGKEYALVVSWVSNPKEFGSQKKDLALRVKFPTNKLYYPLKLTSVYGSQIIPITIYFRGHVSPKIYDFIKYGSETDYFISENYTIPPELDSFFDGSGKGNLKYTRLNINTQSHNLKHDLWVSTFPPLSVIFADFGLTLPSPLFGLLLFALFSCLASFLAARVVYGREVKPLHSLLLGLSNFASLLGVSLASYKLLLKEETGEKFPKRIILFFIPLFLFLIFLILLRIVDTGGGLLLFGIIFLFSLLILVYFLSTIPLISFSFVTESSNLKNAFYLILVPIIMLLFIFSFVVPWAIAGYTLLPGWIIIVVLLIPLLSLFIRPLRERLKQIRGFKLIVVSVSILALTPILLHLIDNMPSGSILRTILELLILGLFYLLMLLAFSSLLTFFISIPYAIHLQYSTLRREISALNRRIFYSGVLVNILIILLALAKFVTDYVELTDYRGINYWVLIPILVLALIYLVSTTSLWYFIMVRKELTQHHRFFLFVILFSVFFALISFFSTEILLLEYRPL